MYKKKNRAKIMDLEKFFDTVCQSKLIEILSRSIKEGRGISMIYNNLNVGVVQHSVSEHSEQEEQRNTHIQGKVSRIRLLPVQS